MSVAAEAATDEVYQVLIEDTGEAYPCGTDRDLLRSMERLGRKGIPAGCRGGGCGVCKVRILSGSVTSKKMSRAHVTEEEEKEGFVLACRSFPSSDVRLAVVGKMRKSVCRVIPEGGSVGAAAGHEGGRDGSPSGAE
jgi:ferredoxin